MLERLCCEFYYLQRHYFDVRNIFVSLVRIVHELH